MLDSSEFPRLLESHFVSATKLAFLNIVYPHHVCRIMASTTQVRELSISFPCLGSQLPREWVASCLGLMTDGNREEAQAELRQVISDAYSSKTLWTTDWVGVQLKRCSRSGCCFQH